MKRTETYEDRCNKIIQDSLDIKPSEQPKTPVNQRKSSLNKTTSDFSFDKKHIQSAQKTTYTDHYQGHDVEQANKRRTYVSEESDTDRSFTKETVASKMRKTKPERRATDEIPSRPRTDQQRFTSFEHDTVKVTRDGNQTEEELTGEELVERKKHLTKDTVSSYLKKVNAEPAKIPEQKRHDQTKQYGTTEDETTDDEVKKQTKTVKETVTVTLKKAKEPQRVNREPEHQTRVDQPSEHFTYSDNTSNVKEDFSSTFTKETVSSALKKINAEVPNREPSVPKGQKPTDSDKFINTERQTHTDGLFSTIKNIFSTPAPTLSPAAKTPRDEEAEKRQSYNSETLSSTLKKVNANPQTFITQEKLNTEDSHKDKRFTTIETETIKATRGDDEPRTVVESEDEYITTKRTSYASDTISSSLKKNAGDKPRDQSPERSDRSIEKGKILQKETSKNSLTAFLQQPEKYTRTTTDELKIVIDEKQDDHLYSSDTISSNLKKHAGPYAPSPDRPNNSRDRSVERGKFCDVALSLIIKC